MVNAGDGAQDQREREGIAAVSQSFDHLKKQPEAVSRRVSPLCVEIGIAQPGDIGRRSEQRCRIGKQPRGAKLPTSSRV